MSDSRTYPPGVPCWIDTEQPDVDAAQKFYGGLFGWTLQDAIPAEVPDTYLIASLGDRPAAAIGPGAAAAWNVYIAVDDADATAAAVVDAGGSIVIEPADAGPGGRLVGCADPGGALFRLWQPRARPGVQVTNEPGSWNFNTLHTADVDAAKAFYGRVFGWQFTDLGGAVYIRRPGYGKHLADTIDPGIYERQSSGGIPAGFEDAVAWIEPAESDYWDFAFAVADCEQSSALAVSLGATVVKSERGEWTVNSLIRDPQGAELILSQYLG